MCEKPVFSVLRNISIMEVEIVNHVEDDIHVALADMDMELSKLRIATGSTDWIKAHHHLKSVETKNQRALKTFSALLGQNGSNHTI